MKSNLILTVIGGGSSYTPELIEGILDRAGELPVGQLRLVDIPSGERKLAVITELARRMAKRRGSRMEITAALDRRTALDGADFVLTQFRVGGLEARGKDELLPLRYDMIGQETTGPGGLANALRTIPIILDVCADMQAICPDAWLINFTNPAGIVTEAVAAHTGVKVIGLCNVPISMRADIARLLDVNAGRISADFAGLNHLGFITQLYLDGHPVMDKLLSCYEDSAMKDKVTAISDFPWDVDFIRAVGAIPGPYLRYYYITKTMLAEEREAVRTVGSRAAQVQALEAELFEIYENPELCEKPKQLESRGGAHYSEAAVSLVSAIYNDKNEIHTVNTLNNGALSDLPPKAVVEVNCLVGAQGARPLAQGPLDNRIAGLVRAVKSYEQLAVAAAVTGSRQTALAAMLAHPLVTEYAQAKALLDDLIEAHAPYLAYLS